MEQMSNVVQV